MEIDKIKDLKRIRYTTSHPIDFSEDLIEIYKISEKLMPLVHLPVQSGSNKILKLMNRKHTIEEYIEIINKLKIVKPNIKFSSDFIIGYPGETYNDYEQTVKLMKDIKFINSFSFIYSARPGTPASNLSEINEIEAKRRLINFQTIAEKIKINYKKSLMDKIVPVLFENEMKTKNEFFGRDAYFNSIVVKNSGNLKGKIKNVKILKSNQNTLFGEVAESFGQTNHAA
jgi:tRNA-2-methylthio-N6-dimethylallyladenosine synthase